MAEHHPQRGCDPWDDPVHSQHRSGGARELRVVQEGLSTAFASPLTWKEN